jgi:ABC-type glycerol-3-phosphate transport system permease component
MVRVNNVKTGIFVRHSLTHLFIIALGLIMIYPILWMIVSSFKPNNMIFSDPGLIPKTLTVENYVSGWKGYAGTSFGRFFVNSLLMCAIAVIGNLIACTMAAYAFARLNFVGRGFWFAAMMLTLMLPGHVTIVPRYILFNTFGWVGTYLPILVPKYLATDAFFVFLLVQFIRSLPKELDEAAIIDGCTKVGVFLRIIVPLATDSRSDDDRLVHVPVDVGRLFQPPAVPHEAGNVHRIEGAAHVRRRRRLGIQLGRRAGDGHAVYGPHLYPVLLPAEILRTGYRNLGHKGIVKYQEDMSMT